MQCLPSLASTRLRQSCRLSFSSCSAPESRNSTAAGWGKGAVMKSYCLDKLLVKSQSGPMKSCCPECFPQVSLRHKVGQTALLLQSSGGKEERHGHGGESRAGNKQGVKTAQRKKRYEEGWAGKTRAMTTVRPASRA